MSIIRIIFSHYFNIIVIQISIYLIFLKYQIQQIMSRNSTILLCLILARIIFISINLLVKLNWFMIYLKFQKINIFKMLLLNSNEISHNWFWKKIINTLNIIQMSMLNFKYNDLKRQLTKAFWINYLKKWKIRCESKSFSRNKLIFEMISIKSSQ